MRFEKGHIPWGKGKKKPWLSERLKIDNPMKNPEISIKSGNSRKGRKSPETSERMKNGGAIHANSFQNIRPYVSERLLIDNPMKRPEVRVKFIGPNHPNWQGGLSFEPYSPSFNNFLKEQIRERDNYQCQECDIFQKDLSRKLDVHHIDFDKKNDDPLNLISLCKSCHSQTNYDREDWMDYFKNKVLEQARQVEPNTGEVK